MAEKAPLSSMTMIDIPKVEGIKNPTGIGTNPEVSSALGSYNQSIEDFANALEQRYARPNLAKISAAFLKPQLGGFSASLGSAMDVMGEQRELERAIAPTVAQMRSQLSLNKYNLAQQTEAANIAGKAAKEGRIPNPTEAASIAGYTQGPGSVPAAGQASSTAQTNQIAQQIQLGATYTDLTAKLPAQFVDAAIFEIKRQFPNFILPADTPQSLKGSPPSAVGNGTQAAPAGGQAPAAQGTPAIAGVPEGMTSSLPISQQLEAQAQNVAAIQEARDKLNTKLTEQSNFAAPIFEAATNLYKAASNPDLEKAFGIFEKGDPLGALGKAVESGSFPRLFETARSQIIAARLGGDREKRAISDLQAMEGALSALKVQMQNGVINPTDFRSVAEGESIPGIRNTQDAFLRGVARIGSEALSKFETKAAFDKALEDKKFNVQNWGSSPYFTQVQSAAQKRTQNLITNRASQELPLFMQKGLTGSSKPPESDKPASSSGTPSNRPNERPIGGTYWRLEGKDWVDTGRKAP